jgi:hypothetical protein
MGRPQSWMTATARGWRRLSEGSTSKTLSQIISEQTSGEAGERSERDTIYNESTGPQDFNMTMSTEHAPGSRV